MDYQAIAWISVLVAAVLLALKLNLSWAARPGYEYRRVFNAAAAGLLLTIAGAIGWELKHSHGFFQGTKWVGGPIWWQLGVGIALLLLAVFWARRVPQRPTPR
jgi:hypothetical protein